MTREQLGNKIKRKLGWPTVKVELTSAAIDDCISDALTDARKYGYGTFLHKRFYVMSAYSEKSGFIGLASSL